jgi:hypothetical protein
VSVTGVGADVHISDLPTFSLRHPSLFGGFALATARLLHWQGLGGIPPPPLESRNHPPSRTRRPPPESGGESARPPVRPPWQPVARRIRRFSSVPPCLRGEGLPGGLGRSPLQGSGLMGVPLTQAVGLGFVRSPLWGSKTWTSSDRPFGAQKPGPRWTAPHSLGSGRALGAQRPRRTLPDLGSSALHFISH